VKGSLHVHAYGMTVMFSVSCWMVFSSSARYSVQHCVSKPKLSHGPLTKSRRDPVLPIHFAEMAIQPVAREQDSEIFLKFLEPVKPDCLWV